MKNVTKKKIQELRRERNAGILHRMSNGEPLTAFNSVSSWFPPRPIIKKSDKDVETLYGAALDRRLAHLDDEIEEQVSSSDKKPTPMRIA